MRLFKDIGPLWPLVDSPVVYPGERLADVLMCARMNGAPIDSSSSTFYDDDDDDDVFVVDPATDIRTDRFALAEFALMDAPRSAAAAITESAGSSVQPVETQEIGSSEDSVVSDKVE